MCDAIARNSLDTAADSGHCWFQTFYGGSELPYSKICEFIFCKYQGNVCTAVRASDGFACGQGKVGYAAELKE